VATYDLLERLLTSLHGAAIEPTRWTAAAGLLNEAVGTKGHALGVGGGLWPGSKISFARISYGTERRRDLEQEYFRDHWPRDDRIPRLVRLRPGELTLTRDLYTKKEEQSSFTYNELLRDRQAQNGLNVRLHSPEGLHIMWLLADSETPGGWDSDQIGTIELILPHLRQFVRVRQALVHARALGSTFSELLDTARVGVIELNRHARIVAANDRACDLLREGDGLVDREGSLSARNKPDNSDLQRLLARALPPTSFPGSAGSMMVGRGVTRRRLAVHITPVAGHEWDLQAQRVAALVLVVDPESQPRIEPRVVGEALGLTPSESRLAAMLATGHTVGEIAAMTDRSEGTVRWHLKNVFRTLGIERQTDLVRLVLSLEGFPGSPKR